MIHKKPNASQVAIMNPKYKQIVFSPDYSLDDFTYPSYHLPAFYELWSIWAKNDRKYWNEVADISRDFFQKSANTKTGLFFDYAIFTGEPQKTNFNSNSHLSAFDSFRVIQNIATDYLWFGNDNREVESVNKILKFFADQGNYFSIYTLDGKPQVNYRARAQVSMNPVGTMISYKPYAKRFIQDLWSQETPRVNTDTIMYYFIYWDYCMFQEILKFTEIQNYRKHFQNRFYS